MRQITPKRFLTVITVILTALTFAHPGRSQSPSQTAPGRDMNFERAVCSVASKEIEEAAQARRDLNNLYQLQVSPESFDQQMIETQIEDIITRRTTEDDTHPSPIDRFRLAQRIVCNDPPSSNAMVWDLFASRESLTAEMSKLIDDRVKESAAA